MRREGTPRLLELRPMVRGQAATVDAQGSKRSNHDSGHCTKRKEDGVLY